MGVTYGFSIPFLILATSLRPLLKFHAAQDRQEDMSRAFKEMQAIPSKETFDFIIVGAGTAGCILARRLSEIYRVLVLEAGGEPPPEEETLPQLSQMMKYLPAVNWVYNSTKQARSGLEWGGIITATIGKMMGGTGSHNNVQYERGHPFGFDQWANVTKDDSWKFENVLKYFLKSENYHGRYSMLNGNHRRGGFVNVERAEVTFRDDLFFSAGAELGFETGLDPNGPQSVGFAGAEYNMKRGRRVSTYNALVKPAEKLRRNLVIRRYSVVTQILIENKQAVGVLYTRHGVPRVAYASKEVIICAGGFMSPVILLKSGIGPAGIVKGTPIADLPVGQNLQDHVILSMPSISVEDKSIFKTSLGTANFTEFEQFKKTGTGLLGSLDAMHEAFIASTRATSEGWTSS